MADRGRVHTRMTDVPDCLLPSSNSEGIPDLDLSMQGDFMDYPRQWGSVARTSDLSGRCITFLVDDKRFDALGTAVEHGHHWRKLWERPAKVWLSGAPSFIEVNFSTSNAQPYYRALWQTGKKRFLSRLFQEHGMRCWVDLNVAERWEELNLLGVPLGWRAYATHFQKYYTLDLLLHQADLARCHAGTDNILFAVFAHNRDVGRLCAREGWLYCGEDWKARDEAKARKRSALQSEKHIKIEPKNTLESWL